MIQESDCGVGVEGKVSAGAGHGGLLAAERERLVGARASGGRAGLGAALLHELELHFPSKQLSCF